MESPILKQIAKFLQDKKKYKRWLAVFVCLAVVVGFATTAALKMRGKAMTHDERVLNCKLQVHQHAETCYDQEKNIICGYADYVVHKHNDDCYDPHNGNLVCALPEVEAHQHTDECYQEQQALACGLEESEGHQHTEECRTKEQGELTCQAEEHTHTEECQAEDGAFSCGKEEHTHADECYQWTETLTCGQEESEGHHHTEACNQVQKTLVCQRPEIEVHTHGDECYQRVLITPEGEEIVQDPKDNTGVAQEVLAGTANKEVPEGRIEVRRSCGKLQVEEHTHTQENGCIEIHEVLDGSDLRPVEEEPAETPEASADGTDETPADGNENQEGNPENGQTPMDGTEKTLTNESLGNAQTNWDGEEEDITKTFKGNGFIVTAAYKEDANIPNDAALLAERVTAESDEEHYAEREAQFDKMTKDTDVSMKALLKVGFYLEGEEIEPESPVTITVQFLGKNGLPDGAPIKVVHFAKDGNDVLDGSKVENGSTSFEMDSFSEIAIGVGPEEHKTIVPVSKSYKYKGDMFRAVFHVEGNVAIPDSLIDDAEMKENKQGESGEAEGKIEEGEGEVKETSNEPTVESLADAIEFVVEQLDDKAEEYELAAAAYEETPEEFYANQVLSYALVYEGTKLDLSDCKVTMEVTPTRKLLDYAEKEGSSASDEGAELQEEVTLSIIDFVKEGAVNQVIQNRADADVSEEEEGSDSDETDVFGDEESVPAEDGIEESEGDKTGVILGASSVTDSPLDVTLNATGTDNSVAASVSSQANPNFTVEFYANIEVFADSAVKGDENKITVIDTSKNKALPVNGGTFDTKDIFLKSDNTVLMTTKEEEVYSSGKYDYITAPSLLYFNKIEKNENYVLSEIKVKRKDGQSWESYDCSNKKEWHFTNKSATQASDPEKFILVTEGAIIRLLYNVNEQIVENSASFHDYDVTDGSIWTYANNKYSQINRGDAKNHNSGDVWYMYTNRQGINNNGTDQTFGFGNAETTMPTTMGDIEGNGANSKNAKYGSPTFGLVKSLKDGKINYANNVKAPNLFDEGTANGKTSYSGSLIFKQKGDTYLLSGTKVMENGVVCSEQQGKEKFTRQRWNWNTTYYFAGNDFYPLDGVSSAGGKNHDLIFGAPDTTVLKSFKDKGKNDDTTTKYIPKSDDEQNHNHYFGMNYTVNFSLVKDYIGPLDYLFYGDDDMWVFLDGPGIEGKLICDIGGVHSAVGEYVDLWNYIPKGSEGDYKLSFFYTERGASGSTCWMQFTLPSVSFATTEQDTAQLEVSKKVTGKETSDEFGFEIEFKDENGNTLQDDYSYTKYEIVEGVEKEIEKDILIWNDAKFTLKAGEHIRISFLPEGTVYTITEIGPVEVNPTEHGQGVDWNVKPDNPYAPDISGGDNPTGTTGGVTGTVSKNEIVQIKYNNIEKFVLPETGGFGTTLYTMAGVAAILLGAGFMYRKKFREGRVGGSS